jgi:hypothetical protein
VEQRLAEEFRRGKGAADNALDRFAEVEPADLLGRPSAVDGAEHRLDLEVVGPEGRQVCGGEGTAAQDVAVGIFRAGAGRVGAQLEVAGVMQEHGGQGEFELPGVQVRFDAGGVAALENQGEAHGGLQRVLQIVIADVDRRILRMLSGKKRHHVVENRFEPHETRVGIHPGKLGPHKSRNRGGIFGVDGGEHGLAWREIFLALRR